MAEPVQGQAYDFPAALNSVLDTGFQVNPTLETGDVQISSDYVTYINIFTLPIVSPVGSEQLKVDLTATEMTGVDKLVVRFKDQNGDEWNEMRVFLDIPAGSSESVLDILEGDHIETSNSLIINKKGTTTPVLSKVITGSLLVPNVTIRTIES